MNPLLPLSVFPVSRLFRRSILGLALCGAVALPAQPGPAAPRLVNLSTRARVGPGAESLIPGFVIAGAGSETLLIRAIGPTLGLFGVPNPLPRPVLTVRSGRNEIVATNSGWMTSGQADQLAGAAARVGAFALPAGSADCAVLVNLPAGSYTVEVASADPVSGIALAEVYEVAAIGTRLVNLSTRGPVGTGAEALIPGFVVSGSGTEYLHARAVGPTLAEFGVPGVLSRPSLAVVNSSGTVLASNSGWSSTANPAELATTGNAVGAFALPPGSADCALNVALPPGAYTIPISGVNSATGIALGEIYEAQPLLVLNPPSAGASTLSGRVYHVDPATTKIVIYVLTNQWYVQPYAALPYTSIGRDGSWSSFTHPWSKIVVLAVNPALYTPAATMITNPALGGPGVLAAASYPAAPATIRFSGFDWGIKVTGSTASSYRFDPGPNYWSNDSSVVSVDADGRLRLRIRKVDGVWQAAEVHLPRSLGYGTYTVRVNSPLHQLDRNTVACPLFLYASTRQEFDHEFSGSGGLIPGPYNAQFVVQPYTVSGNLVRYVQPAVNEWTSQIEWRPDHVSFRAWKGWAPSPSPSDLIYQWRYSGPYNFRPGAEQVRINLWLLNGAAPTSGVGDEMVISAFSFQP